MKSFSKIIIAFALVSLFIASPLFAEDYVYKIPANRTSSNSLAAASSSTVLGPYSASSMEWGDSTSAKVYLTDSSGKTSTLSIYGPSTALGMIGAAFTNHSVVYLFLDSSNYVTNIGFII